MSDNRATQSIPASMWQEAPLPHFAPLVENQDADVVVIGGGITGLTTALLLAAGGKSVIVLERATLAGIDSGHTSAHLTMATDTRLVDLASRFGETHTQAVWHAGLTAMRQIEAIVEAHAIDCGFARVDGYLHAPVEGRSLAVLDVLDRSFRDEATLARRMGFDVTRIDDVPLVTGPGLRFANQARIDPCQYLAGLALAVVSRGGFIHEHSDAARYAADTGTVTANGCTVRCGDIVVATHSPAAGVSDALASPLLQSMLALYTTYVVAGRVARGLVPDSLFWDTSSPYRYMRLAPGDEDDVLVLGGEDHKTGQDTGTDMRHARLARALDTMVPGTATTWRWSGQVVETTDGLPLIGAVAPHQYLATGYAGNGLTFGTFAAMQMADALLGHERPWAALFSPSRTPLAHGFRQYLTENADYPYYRLRDRLGDPTTAASIDDVAPGSGAIVDGDGTRVAVYRAEDGRTQTRSATCTHMGCVVAWNDAERTWDCPCHGSRFRTDGSVISGPAGAPLDAWPPSS